MYVCHAEANSIDNFRGNKKELEGAKIYVDLFPCNECAKRIIQSGIKEVIYLSDKYSKSDSTIVSKRLFDECGVKYRCLDKKYQNDYLLSIKPDIPLEKVDENKKN
jgi:dCMP deaminase